MPSQAMNLKASAFGNFMEWFSLQIIYMVLGASANVMSFHRARTGRALTSVDPRSGYRLGGVWRHLRAVSTGD